MCAGEDREFISYSKDGTWVFKVNDLASIAHQ